MIVWYTVKYQNMRKCKDRDFAKWEYKVYNST